MEKISKQRHIKKPCVYLIKMNDSNFYKIGRTIKPYYRYYEIQCANPIKLELLHIYETEHYKKLERNLHSVYKKWNHVHLYKSEWYCFKVEKDIVIKSFIEECKSYLKVNKDVLINGRVSTVPMSLDFEF
jgi:hypothetical protein